MLHRRRSLTTLLGSTYRHGHAPSSSDDSSRGSPRWYARCLPTALRSVQLTYRGACMVQVMLLVSAAFLVAARQRQADFLDALPPASTCDASIPTAFYGVGSTPTQSSLQLGKAGLCTAGKTELTLVPSVGGGINGTAAHSCLSFLPCVDPSDKTTCTTVDGARVSPSSVVSCFCRSKLSAKASNSLWGVVFPGEDAGGRLCEGLFHKYWMATGSRLLSSLVVSIITTMMPSAVSGTLLPRSRLPYSTRRDLNCACGNCRHSLVTI